MPNSTEVAGRFKATSRGGHLFKRKRLVAVLAVRAVDAEGDYNSTTLATAMFSQLLLDLVDQGGPQAGLSCVEDPFDLDAVRATLSDNRIVIHTLAD